MLPSKSRRAAGVCQILKEGKSAGTLRDIYAELAKRVDSQSRVPVVYHRDKAHIHVGKPGRLYSGVDQVAAIPADLKKHVFQAVDKGVPLWRATASIFEYLPRDVKELFRIGLGVQDPDQPKCFPRAMVERHPWSVHLKRWVEDRQGHMKR